MKFLRIQVDVPATICVGPFDIEIPEGKTAGDLDEQEILELAAEIYKSAAAGVTINDVCSAYPISHPLFGTWIPVQSFDGVDEPQLVYQEEVDRDDCDKEAQ